MSSVPKAKYSQITELSVEPDNWDAYPTVDRSNLTRCIYRNLDSNTKIERSTLKGVIIAADPSTKKPSDEATSISRSNLFDSEIHASIVERSEVKDSRTTHARLERSILNQTKLVGASAGAQVRSERSNFTASEVTGRSNVSRTVTKESVLEDVKADRSTVTRCFVTGCKLDRATLVECDVKGCEIRRSTFKGKFLRNGRWDSGNLVGRVDESMEVVVRDMDDPLTGIVGRDTEASGETGVMAGPSSEVPPPEYTPSGYGSADAPRDMHIVLEQGPPALHDAKAAEAEDEKGALAALDYYNGPRISTPPPYKG